MGIKGAKLSQGSVVSAEDLVEKLGPIGGITSKKMFGGHGIFHDGKMFGLIDSKGKAFLKVDDSLKAELESMGAQQHSRMPYYSIPEAIWKNGEKLIKWAHRSIELSK